MQPRLVNIPRLAVGLLAFALCALETGCRKRAAEVPVPDGPPLSAAAEQALAQLVQGAVSEFFKQHKRYTKSIAELQEARLLELIQSPPAGKKFVINPADGRFGLVAK